MCEESSRRADVDVEADVDRAVEVFAASCSVLESKPPKACV